MRKTLYITFVLVLFSGSNLYAEALFGPSKSELASQKLIAENRNELIALKQRVNELNERIDGLTTVIEGLSNTINMLQRLQNSQAAQAVPATGDLGAPEPKIDQAKRDDAGQKQLTPSDSYQSSHVKVSNEITPPDHTSAPQSSVDNPGVGAPLDGESNLVLYGEGVRLFQKQEYGESEKRFMVTQSKGYKPAASNYYLGEIAYYTKKYSDAIFYFKKSAGIQDQASYIDTLLLHTAISLEKTGDIAQAKVFYQSIIEGYPEKKTAQIARKNLSKL